jgi:predicted Rossmann fold nucleotide-binding protein DprA/Smf involved in DNA uptake
VLACLADGPLGRDALARRLALAPQALAPALLELELAELVRCDRDGRLRRERPPLR